MRKINYSLKEMVYNAFCLMYTRFRFRSCRLIRIPFVVRGEKYIDFGNNLTVGRGCQFEVVNKHGEKCLLFGENVNIGHYVRIQCASRIQIGSGVLMGSRVTIIDHSHGLYKGLDCDKPSTPPNDRVICSSAISIGDNVWIGEGVVIQQGVTIGEGSVIGANSVVTADVPPGCIVGGIPAKIIKKYDEQKNEWCSLI